MIGSEVYRSLDGNGYAVQCLACRRLSPKRTDPHAAIAAWQEHVTSGRCEGLTPEERVQVGAPTAPELTVL